MELNTLARILTRQWGPAVRLLAMALLVPVVGLQIDCGRLLATTTGGKSGQQAGPFTTGIVCSGVFSPLRGSLLQAAGTDLYGVDEVAQPAARQPLDHDFQIALLQVAKVAREQGLKEAAEVTEAWYIPRDSRRFYIFLPDSYQPPAILQQGDQATKAWRDRFQAVRNQQAEALFALAKSLAKKGDGCQANLLLHEVLHENPNHAEARRILGYRRDGDHWTQGLESFSSRRMFREHGFFDWKPGEHWKINTTHFDIDTSRSLEEGERLGKRLETVFDVWEQLFHDYWSDAEKLQRRIDSDEITPRNRMGRGRRKFSVVYFRDRAEYIDLLSKDVPGIEKTFGYYVPQRKESFFYAGDAAAEQTWYHESAHQFFQESIRTEDSVGNLNGMWAVEGIAAFCESLQLHNGYATLGGADASWLQYARFRCLSERSYIPIVELATMSKNELQTHPSIQLIYSQSAGLAHFLMTGENQKYRAGFVKYLQRLYEPGPHRPDELFTLTQADPETLDQQYREFLAVDRERVKNFTLQPETLRNLVLSFSDIDDETLGVLQNATQIEWIDLTATKITDKGIKNLAQCQEMTQLFIGGTQVTDSGLETIAQLRSLEELDLVGLRISNAGVIRLQQLPNLRTLRLNSTPIDDRAVEAIQSMESLEFVDLQGTRISREAVERLRGARPQLTVQFNEER